MKAKGCEIAIDLVTASAALRLDAPAISLSIWLDARRSADTFWEKCPPVEQA